MTEHADILITHAHLFTLQGQGVGYIADGALAVQGSHIAAVGSTAELTARFHADETLDASGRAVLPGLIDAHMHTRLAILRGVAQDVAHWMQRALAPYARYITPEAALAGTKLNVMEALKAGTTTFGEYATPVPGWAQFFAETGVRARLTPTINAMPPGGMAGWKVGDVYPLDPAVGRASIDEAVAFARDWHDAIEGRITVMLGPQGPDMLPRDQLLEVKRAAQRLGLMIHMHVAQGDRETDQMLKRFGQRTPGYLNEIGYLDEQLLAVSFISLNILLQLLPLAWSEPSATSPPAARKAWAGGTTPSMMPMLPEHRAMRAPRRATRAASSSVASVRWTASNCSSR